MNLFQLATSGIDLEALPTSRQPEPVAEPSEPSQAFGRSISVPREIDSIIQEAAATYGIDPNVVRGVAFAESGFDPDVISGKRRSSAGAVGLMQFMPATAKELDIDPLNVREAIFGGAYYLRKNLDKFDGDYGRAVAAYNWGPNRDAFQRDDWFATIPKETDDYLKRVFSVADSFGGEAEPKPDASIPLPEGVQPSQAGGGRGVINPEIGVNNYQEQKAVKRDEFAPVDEVVRGVKTGVTGLKQLWESNSVLKDATLAANMQERLSAFDRIDAGAKDVPRAIGLAYQQAGPEDRQRLRGVVQKELGQRRDFLDASLATIKQYQADMQRTKGRVSEFTDIQGVKDFTNWLAFNGGSGVASMAPLILSAATGPLAPAVAGAVGLGMATGEINNDRIDYARKKGMDNKGVADYVADKAGSTVGAAIPFAAMDVVAGPVGSILSTSAKGGVKALERMGVRQAAKEIAKDTAEEFVTGGAQEAIKLATGYGLDETDALLTAENAKKLLNSAASEAAGGLTGGGGRVAGVATLQAIAPRVESQPSTPQAPVVPRQEPTIDVTYQTADGQTVTDVVRGNAPEAQPDTNKAQAVDNIAKAILEAESKAAQPAAQPLTGLAAELEALRARNKAGESATPQTTEVANAAPATGVSELGAQTADDSLGGAPTAGVVRTDADGRNAGLPGAPTPSSAELGTGPDGGRVDGNDALTQPQQEIANAQAPTQTVATPAQPVPASRPAAMEEAGVTSTTTQQTNATTTQNARAQAAPTARTQVQTEGPATRLGRDNTPLTEGGKPYKSRQSAADAKKMQPMMRVVKVDGGYALAEKTPAQIAAMEKAAQRLRNANTSPAGEPIPAHSFIAAAGGMQAVTRNDMGVDGNPRVGNRRLFAGAGRGLSIEQATQMLIADGYLAEGASQNDAYALIKKSLTQPQYNATGYEQMAEMDAAARFDDYLAAQEESAMDADFDPFADGLADGYIEDDFDASGFAGADEQIQLEVRALQANADALGLDSDALIDEAVRATVGKTDQEYYEYAKQLITNAIRSANSASTGGRSNGEAVRDGQEQPRQGPQRGSLADDSTIDGGQGSPGADGEGLTRYTAEEVTGRQDAVAQAEAATQRAENAAGKAEAAAKQAKEIAQRSVAAADTFELGGNAEDNLSGQGGLQFSKTSKPIAILDGSEVAAEITHDNAVEVAREWYRANLQGDTVIRDGFGEVRFTSKGWGELKLGLRNDALKAKLLPAVRSLIQSGEYHGREELYKQRADSITAFHFFSGKVSVDGKVVTAGVTVGEDAFGNLFYNVTHNESRFWKDRSPLVLPRENAEGPKGLLVDGEPPTKQSMSDDDGNVNLVILDGASSATPVANIRTALASAYGNLLPRLESKGLVTLTQTQDEAIDAAARARADKDGGDVDAIKQSLMDGVEVKRSTNGDLEGFFDPQTGQSFLIADNLTAEAAPGTLMHEVGIHMAADGKLQPLFDRAAQILRLGRSNPFIQRVQSRMDAAGETSGEEAAAYIVTEYENDRAGAPSSVASWVKDFIADVRAWLFSKGVLLKADQLSVADIAAVARANARRMAQGGLQGVAGGDVRASRQGGQDGATDPEQPMPQSRWRDNTGRWQFAPGQWLYDKLGDRANVLLSLAGMKAASPELKRQLRRMKLDVQKAQEVSAKVATEAAKFTPEERAMVSDLVEQTVAAGTLPPEHAVKMADLINTVMGKQTDELVELGMLEKDTADRWRGQYLPRYYESKMLKKDAWTEAMMGLTRRAGIMKGIKGKHLKGRGMFETVAVEQKAAYEALGWEVRDPDFDAATDDSVQMWRDFTPEERSKMGEIRDAGFRFVMGYMQTQKDIALGRMYRSIAQDESLSSRTPTEKLSVRVPDSKIEGTGTNVYGELAGRYVSDETLSVLSSQAEVQNDLLTGYRKALGLWKEGKTVLNPVSHMNNMVSNLTMAHLAGVSYHRVDKYLGAIRDFARKDSKIQEAKDAGLFLGSFNETELYQSMPEELKALANKAESKVDSTVNTAMKLLTFGLRAKMQDAYGFEDDFFKYLIYKDARNRGASPQDAVDFAQRYIFTYDDLPKGARILRDSALPFFSYTYKAVPALLHTALTQPHRMATPAALLYGASMLAYAIAAAEGDEPWDEIIKRYVTDADFREKVSKKKEEDQKNLPPWQRGYTAFMTPKAMLVGHDKALDLPVYMDVSRFIPGGDIFDVVGNAGGLPLPAPITPSHPLLSIGVAMIGNRDLFTGKDLVDKNDTAAEAAAKRSEWMWKQVSPAIAIGNYHWERGMNMVAQASGQPITFIKEYTGRDKSGMPMTPDYGVPQVFGIKLRPVDFELSKQIQQGVDQQTIRQIQAEVRQLERLHSKGAATEGAVLKAREKAQEKISNIRRGLTVDGSERE